MKVLAVLSVVALLCAALLGGAAPFGRILMATGLNGWAGRVFTDTEWQGVAQYRAQDFDRAATLFAQAGASYDLGLAETRRGNFAAALEAFDVAITRGHPDARANFDVVAAYYAGLGIDVDALALFADRKDDGPTEDSSIARGNARAAGSGNEVTNTNAMLGLTQVQSRGNRSVRQVFDDKFIVADSRWLEQLGDVPGEYMAERIKQEHRRRMKLGLSPPPPENPEDRQ
ncbi:MAG: hypothetical protein WBB25_05240 [Sulfitobacter sp.]